MFKLIDNREFVYQWDTNVAVSIDDSRVKEAHFCNRTSDCSLVVEVKDGIANVPNIILQQNYDVKVFAYDGKATLFEQTIKVVGRTRPADYVYEETEIIRYEDISKRMNALEENLESTVVEEVIKYMEENPVNVDLSDYYTKEEVDTALANNKEVYRIDFSEAPSGEANAIQATTEMIEFVERYNAKENVYLIIKDIHNAFGYNGWTATIISGLSVNLRIRPDFIDLTKITQQSASRYYTYTLRKSNNVWTYYKEKLADINLTTKEYVDEAIANLDIPEADVDLTGYATEEYVDNAIANIEIPEVDLSSCIKFYNFNSLASPSEADYAKLKEIIETDDVNAYLFTVEGTHKVLRTSNMGGGNILIVYGVWNGPTNNTIYGYQVDYKNATSTLLVNYKMTSSEEVQTMINNAFNNIGVAEGGAY